jgi:hypothetical protein
MKTLFLACSLLAATPAFSAFIFDPDMNAVDYGFNQVSLVGTATFNTNSTGFNRTIGFTLPSATAASYGEMNTAHLWTPSTDGTITSIAFSLDTILATAGTFDFFDFAFRQSGTVTPLNLSLTPGGLMMATWTGSLTGPNPVQFGYLFSSTNPIFAGPTLSSNLTIDNFCVIVNNLGTCSPNDPPDLPEPATYATVGAAMLALGVWRRFRR